MVERIRAILESRQLTPTQFADLIGVARPIVSHILSGRNKPSLDVVQRILAALPDLAMPWLLTGSGPMLAAASALADGAVPSAATIVPLVPAVPVAAALPERDELLQPSENQQYLPVARVVIAPTPPAITSVGRHISKPAEHAGRVSKPAPFKANASPKRFVAEPLAVDKPREPSKAEANQPYEPAPEPALASIGPDTNTTASESCQVAMPVNGLPIANASGAATKGIPDADTAPASAMAQALFAGAEKPIRRIVIFYRDGSFADYQPE